MYTVGLVELGGTELGYVSASGNSWKLVQLAARGRIPEHAFSNPKIGAIAIIGQSPEKAPLAEKALLRKKHVLVDFPPAQTVDWARKLEAIAAEKGVCIYSPNLMKTETGFQELKRLMDNSTSKMLSVTMTCRVDAKLRSLGFSMKLAQLLDVIEWVAGSRIKEIYGETSAKRSHSAALVALASFDTGLRVLLNMYSAPFRSTRLWVDVVFKDSVVHVEPYAQSIRVTPFQEKSMREVNWATSSLTATIEDFMAHISSEKQVLDLENLERMFGLARAVTVD